MKNSWIKLYHEILIDPKMGRMSDHLYRRTIELFLLAGMEDNNGLLPDIEGIAWSLHTTEKDIQAVIDSLMKLGIVEEYFDPILVLIPDKKLPKRYVVKNFANRQNTQLSDAERAKKYRDNKKTSRTLSDDCSENVTVDKDIDKDKDKEEIKKEKREREDKEENRDVPSHTTSQKPTKHQHGNFSHVLLTDDEYKKLSEKFPDVEQRIQKLDDYLENNRKKHYDNHYLTILNWARRDEQQQTVTTFVKPEQKKTYTFSEIVAMNKQKEQEVIDL